MLIVIDTGDDLEVAGEVWNFVDESLDSLKSSRTDVEVECIASREKSYILYEVSKKGD